jgi:hypothetical protein
MAELTSVRTHTKKGAVPSILSVPKVPQLDQVATSARAKKGKPAEHVQLFRMK